MATGVVMNGNVTLDTICELADSFKWVEERKGQAVDTVVIAREPVGVVAAIAPWNAPYMHHDQQGRPIRSSQAARW